MSQVNNTKPITNSQAPDNIGDILNRLKHVKGHGANKWAADCPAPGHATPGGHLSIEDAGDKALVTCFGSNHTYPDICHALGFDSLTYNRPGVFTTPTTRPAAPKHLPDFTELANRHNAAIQDNNKALDYLRSRFIDSFDVYRWRLGYDAGRNAISIPHEINGKVPAIKYRLLGTIEHGERYTCEPGSDLAHIFNPEQITDVCYLCEGEFDAMVATCNGFDACALPGGAGSFKPEFVKYFAKVKDLFLLLDADKGGNDGMDAIASLMPDKAIPVHLPDGLDVTDFFLAGYSPDYLLALVKKAYKNARLPKVNGAVRL